jgi:lysophospholipase L1-like esterase
MFDRLWLCSPIALLATTLAVSISLEAAEPKPLGLKSGDRVVFVGDTLIEREPLYGHWEAEIRRRLPGEAIVIRNRGYSADTPAGLSRSMFDAPPKGHERLLNSLKEGQPTVVVIGYGMSYSLEHEFDSPDGVAPFIKGLSELVRFVETDLKARVVILSPVAHLPTRLVSDEQRAEHNQRLELLTQQLQELAGDSRGFVDLYHPSLLLESAEPPASDNGIHLNDAGYKATASLVADALVGKPASAVVDGEGLKALTEAIRRKNELDFNRWRPQNWTYLYGFRRHEQGQNAAEVERLDPLILEADAAITPLTKP